MLEKLYYGNTIIQWSIALALIFISVISSRAITSLFTRWATFITSKTETDLDDMIIEALKSPLNFIIIILGIRFSLGTLTLSESVDSFSRQGFHFLIALTMAWLIVRFYEMLHEAYLVPFAEKNDNDLDGQLLPLMRLGLTFGVWTLGTIVGLNNAGYDVGAVIAGLGIGGLAFALAAQDTVANVFGGITVLILRPFKIGDLIEVDGNEGRVEEIGLRSSIITNFSGETTSLPNSIFTENPVRNINTRSSIHVETSLNLHHDTTPEQIQLAIDLLQDIARRNELVEDTAWVYFDQIGDLSFNLVFRYGVKLWQPEDKEKIGDWLHKLGLAKTKINLAIMKRFEAHYIKLAWPVEIGIEPPTQDAKGIFFGSPSEPNLLKKVNRRREIAKELGYTR